MIPSPYRYEPELSDQEYAKLGVLSLRWSQTEHILGNCLKVLLRLTEEEAVIMVFPLSAETRLQRIDEISKINSLTPFAKRTFDELRAVMRGTQYVRNNVVHAVVSEHDTEGHVFHLRSKGRSLTKAQVFGVEELTNYASHLAIALRLALGFKDGEPPLERAWPDRPPIPEFLQALIQWPKVQ